MYRFLCVSNNPFTYLIELMLYIFLEDRLEQFLEKRSSWSYLLDHNYTDGISNWLSSKSAASKFVWPEQLFLQWDVDELMVDQVVKSDCTDLTKLIVCNHLAS